MMAHCLLNVLEQVVRTKDGIREEVYVGYFKTSQPVSAGVYVLAELKPPAGYARSKPVAIEVYSDETSYYVDGDMYAKVAAVRYKGNLLTDIPYEK